ncbi:hypothetical protein [uncultured Kordia sp.]|uniref:hypothetical protein n=1 Tax=uncultured Kordia sp. TaxID=507699 RepID=UPI0026071005|nr:hypothetical protein [uncultured Kordia sp.]
MITIHFQPSFHKESLITFNGNEISYEILPRLQDVSVLENKEKLKVAEYLKLKKLKAQNLEAEKERFKEKKQLENHQLSLKLDIEKLIQQSIKSLVVDDRIILDGIIIECTISEVGKIEFHSPEEASVAFKIVENLFAILHESFQEVQILEHIQIVQKYF